MMNSSKQFRVFSNRKIRSKPGLPPARTRPQHGSPSGPTPKIRGSRAGVRAEVLARVTSSDGAAAAGAKKRPRRRLSLAARAVRREGQPPGAFHPGGALGAMAAARPFDLQIKLLMIGDSAVGKTSLLLRYANDTFSSTFITTIGIDFKIKTVDLDGRRVKLQIWDTAGQEQFRTITRSYFRGAQGIVLVYDITDRGTFNSVRSWMAQIADHADAQVNRVLVANKSDNEAERRVSSAEGAALAAEYEVKFLETSAKHDINVSETFTAIAREVVARIPAEGAASTRGATRLSGTSGKKKSSCCG